MAPDAKPRRKAAPPHRDRMPSGGLPRPEPFNAAASVQGGGWPGRGAGPDVPRPRERASAGDTRWAAAPPPPPSPRRVPESSPPPERWFGRKNMQLSPPDWLPPGFCVTGCHTISLLRTLDHERHGSAGRRAAVLWGEDSGSLCLV